MNDERITAPVESPRIESGMCLYCGQIHNVPFTVSFSSEAEANKWASEEKCDCPEAKRQRVLRRADAKIEELFVEFDEDVRDVLKSNVRAVIDGAVEAVTVRLDCYTGAKIGENSKGLIIISKIRKTTKQEAIG